MTRVTNQPASRRRKKKILQRAKGFRQGKSKQLKRAREFSERALTYAFGGRKRKKRDFRDLWIARISAACKNNGISYSSFIANLKKQENQLNRKMLADIAYSNPQQFSQIVREVISHI
ncbi:MAG: 50S ribosomal protein L20 [Candidatus Omnitrophica bacterium]|nr:50S ribosomal protein L20 [Candidatus Omnitrophota bacterium]